MGHSHPGRRGTRRSTGTGQPSSNADSPHHCCCSAQAARCSPGPLADVLQIVIVEHPDPAIRHNVAIALKLRPQRGWRGRWC